MRVVRVADTNATFRELSGYNGCSWTIKRLWHVFEELRVADSKTNEPVETQNDAGGSWLNCRTCWTVSDLLLVKCLNVADPRTMVNKRYRTTFVIGCYLGTMSIRSKHIVRLILQPLTSMTIEEWDMLVHYLDFYLFYELSDISWSSSELKSCLLCV